MVAYKDDISDFTNIYSLGCTVHIFIHLVVFFLYKLNLMLISYKKAPLYQYQIHKTNQLDIITINNKFQFYCYTYMKIVTEEKTF